MSSGENNGLILKNLQILKCIAVATCCEIC